MKRLVPFFILVAVGLSSAWLAKDSAHPKIVIVGQTGSGKSTLANVLLGDAPNCKNCTFPICSGQQSCTKKTKYADGRWLGNGAEVVMVDTPGFGDTENDDNSLIDEMMTVLKDTLKGANAIVLLVNGQQQRFNASIQQMLREMQALFGEKFWQYTMMGVSFWSYESASVRQREFTGATEEKFMAEWNRLLSEKFHLNITLQGAFIDSYAKQPWNLQDSKQQTAFRRESGKLWRFATQNDLFMFRTVEDVLHENEQIKAENKQLKDQIAGDIATMKMSIEKNQKDIQDSKKSLQLQDKDIKTNKVGLAGKASLKDLDMSKDEIKMDMNLLQQSTKQKIDATETEIQQTRDHITKEVDSKLNSQQTVLNTQQALINSLKYPLGTILSWVPKPLPTAPHQENIPDGWVFCDGGVISKGVWAGQKTPNLNGEGRFLRGGSLTQALSMEGHMVQDHTHVDNGHTHTDTGHSHPSVTVSGGQLTGKCTVHLGERCPIFHPHPDICYPKFPNDCKKSNVPHYATDAGQYWFDTDKQPKYSAFNLWGHQGLTTAQSAITSAKSGIGGMATGDHGTETRPTNMRVLWIMKAW